MQQKRWIRTYELPEKMVFFVIVVHSHNWLVGFVFEVLVVEFIKFGTHFFQLLFGWTNLSGIRYSFTRGS